MALHHRFCWGRAQATASLLYKTCPSTSRTLNSDLEFGPPQQQQQKMSPIIGAKKVSSPQQCLVHSAARTLRPLARAAERDAWSNWVASKPTPSARRSPSSRSFLSPTSTGMKLRI
ncbi:hypothetical protein NL676_029739 [Syzygium grande]|nr:hypothetical protein NL676_029739 [Syzygium grande]